jgi:branched-chain amino acid transport system substrate-binding protein
VIRVLIATMAMATAVALTACGGASHEPAKRLSPARSIASSGCSPVTYGGPGRPQLLIAASTVLQGQFKEHGVQVAQALKLLLAQRDWKAGPYRIGLQICDETTAKSDFADPRKCASNARAFARNRSVVAVVGPHFSSCVPPTVAVLNKAPGGAIPVISGTATYLGLTRSGPGVGPGEPAKYYKGGPRNFVRVVPADDVQAAAFAIYMKDHGLRRAYALMDSYPYGEGLAEGFAHAARKLGISVAGSAHWNAKAKNYRELARRVAREHPDAVVIAGYLFENGPQLVADLHKAVSHAQLIGSDGMNQPATLVEGAGEAAENFVATIGVVPALTLPAEGRAFAEAFRARYSTLPCCFSVNAAQALQMVLDAIANSGPSRAQIRNALFGMQVKRGLLGDFAIDRHGDTTLTRIGLFRIKDGESRFEGAVNPSATLLARR